VTATARTFYILANAAKTEDSWFTRLQDGGTAPTAANTAYGWTVGKTATTTAFWRARLGAVGAATVAAATSTIDSTNPTAGTGTAITTAGNAWIVGPFNGTFANTAWTFVLNMRASTAGAIGNIRMRVFKSANRNGSSPTALTASTLVTSAGPKTMSTTADVNFGFTWSPGAITLNNEYLFFEPEWQETTAGSNASSNALFRAGSTITTPVFTYSTPYSLPMALAWWDAQDNSKITLTGTQITNWNDSIYALSASRGSGTGTLSAPTWDVYGYYGFQGIFEFNLALLRCLGLPAGLTPVGTPITVIAICDPDFTGGQGFATLMCGNTSGNFHCYINSNGTLGINKQFATTGPQSTGSALGLSICVWQITAANYLYRINGTAQGSGTNSMGAIGATSGGYFLVDATNQTSGEEWAGWIGDIIICGIDLATTDIEIAEGYLAWKYNAVQLLPTTHAFKLAPPSGLVPFLVPPRRSIVTNRRM
jgi:hypothetical protein